MRRIGILLVSAGALDIIFISTTNNTHALISGLTGIVIMTIAYIGEYDE